MPAQPPAARWLAHKLPFYLNFAPPLIASVSADTVAEFAEMAAAVSVPGVAGIEANYGEILRPSLQVVGPAEDAKRAAGLYMLAFPNRELLFFADTTVNIDPDAETLRDIALQTAAFVRELGIEPRAQHLGADDADVHGVAQLLVCGLIGNSGLGEHVGR